MKLKIKKLYHIIISTGLGVGFSPIAPGTVGALMGVAIWVLLGYLFPHHYLPWITLMAIVTCSVLGAVSTSEVEKEWGKDPSRVVIDEIVGVWIPLLAVSPLHWKQVLLAFTLFRVFDIWKPCGVRKMESVQGGWGVMLDDILAGIYSLIVTYLLIHQIGIFEK